MNSTSNGRIKNIVQLYETTGPIYTRFFAKWSYVS